VQGGVPAPLLSAAARVLLLHLLDLENSWLSPKFGRKKTCRSRLFKLYFSGSGFIGEASKSVIIS